MLKILVVSRFSADAIKFVNDSSNECSVMVEIEAPDVLDAAVCARAKKKLTKNLDKKVSRYYNIN
jgi:uncharacterized membrane protein